MQNMVFCQLRKRSMVLSQYPAALRVLVAPYHTRIPANQHASTNPNTDTVLFVLMINHHVHDVVWIVLLVLWKIFSWATLDNCCVVIAPDWMFHVNFGIAPGQLWAWPVLLTADRPIIPWLVMLRFMLMTLADNAWTTLWSVNTSPTYRVITSLGFVSCHFIRPKWWGRPIQRAFFYFMFSTLFMVEWTLCVFATNVLLLPTLEWILVVSRTTNNLWKKCQCDCINVLSNSIEDNGVKV